jgi:Tol biopolymer transport system component
MQLTYPPVQAGFPFISPDGTRVAFHTDKGEIFVISMEGGMPQRIAEEGFLATWSPDGNYLLYGDYPQNAGWQIVDVRTGKSSIPSSQGKGGFWETQDTLVTSNQKLTGFLTFNLKTRTWSDLGPKDVGNIVNWMISPDSKYLYFTTGGAEPKVERIRFADQQIETITGLKDFHRALIDGESQVNVAPDGSPIFTRDTGYQEVYALNVRWP